MKKDFTFVTVIGFLVGWLVLLPAKSSFNLALTVPLIAVSVAGFTVLAPLALAVLKLLARRMPVFEQFGKFAAVGTLNTLLNLAVLNACILATGIAAGWWYSGFIALAFLVATTNSYFWNKFWTFGNTAPVTAGQYGTFALFTLGGVLLNVGAASIVVNIIGAPETVDPKLWANIGALIGVAFSFLWNFISYKRIVFRQVQSAE